MSGIVGLMDLAGGPVDRDLLSGLTQSLAARGPDAQQTWIGDNVGLGHALLRTTWESENERQPYTDAGIALVADCRIDAREELVSVLASHGRRVSRDTPDPELILHAYAVWQTRCVEHLIGDFAFALWDAATRTLFCARDHLGVKPLFYSRKGSGFAFSNDLSCLRRHPAVTADLDELAIADFLVFGFALDTDRSSFSDIRRLPAAHTLTLSNGEVSIRRYWQLPLEDEIRYRRRADYVDQFLELFETATRDRLRSNRVGVFMSGGLDSPAIAATAHRMLVASGAPFDLRAHTIVFDRIVPDEERKYSQLAADALGIPIHHYPFDDYGFPPPEPDPDWYPPEPRFLFDRGRMIAVHRNPAAASRVLLRGDGADPLIDGPPSVLASRLKDGPYGRLLGDFLWLTYKRRQVPRFGIRTILRGALGFSKPPAVQLYPEWLSPTLQRKLHLRQRWMDSNNAEDIRPGFELAHSYWPLYFELIDPGTMRQAAENRYPFVDLRVVRYLLRLPPIPWFAEKSLLRIAMQGRLPHQVLSRPKAPVAGNPWAALLPPADTGWWKAHLVPAPGFEEFVEIQSASAVLAKVSAAAQARNDHKDIDLLRSSLRPVSLNLWLQQIGCARLTASPPVHQETT